MRTYSTGMIRVRYADGAYTFATNTSTTFGDLQSFVRAKTGIEPEQQLRASHWSPPLT